MGSFCGPKKTRSATAQHLYHTFHYFNFNLVFYLSKHMNGFFNWVYLLGLQHLLVRSTSSLILFFLFLRSLLLVFFIYASISFLFLQKIDSKSFSKSSFSNMTFFAIKKIAFRNFPLSEFGFDFSDCEKNQKISEYLHSNPFRPISTPRD